MGNTDEEVSDLDLSEDDFEGVPVFPRGTSEAHRRRLLQAMAGAGTVAVAGCLGFGSGSVSVQTNEAAEVSVTSAVLQGELTELDGADEADVGFEYGEAGGDLDQSTDAGTLQETGAFQTSVNDLEPETEYEFRAVAEIDDDDDHGETLSFTTDPEPEPPHFAVQVDVPEDLGVNEEYELVGTIENVGEETGLQDVTLSLDGDLVDDVIEESVTEEIQLDGGQTETLTLDAVGGAPGDEYTAELRSDDDTATEHFRIGEPDYSQIDFMTPDVRPKQLVKELNVQVAFNDDRIFFRYTWEQPDPGGWIHDMLVYDGDDGEWKRYADWDPWALDEEYGIPEAHHGFYEDRLSWMWHDGTLKGFENFGGWMTVMEGVRTLPGAASEAEVRDHPHFGDDGLGRTDIRKYIPQSRNGEWWEHDWEDVKPQDELDQMRENGEYVDLPMWRAHRSNPVDHGTNHHILDYRHGNETGSSTFDSQSWDAEDGPELMFDPAVVEGGAIDISDVVDEDGNPKADTMPDQQDFEEYALITEGEKENAVEFDPDVAEWDGAMIPRRPLTEPSESGASWPGEGVWEDGQWTVELSRELDTGYVDDMPVEAGESYTFAPALHHGVSQRWHWVSYPLKLAMGDDVEVEDWHSPLFRETSVINAEKVEDEPDWSDVQTYTIPLVYPGLTDWTWLTSGQHAVVDQIRNAEVAIWEHHDENPEAFAERVINLEKRFASRK